MKKLLLLTVLAVFFATPLFADTKMAVVEMQRCVEESNAGKRAMEDLAAVQKEYQNKLNIMQADLQKMAGDLERQQSILSEDKKKERIELLNKKRVDFETAVQNAGNEMRKKEAALMEVLVADLIKIIEEIAKEQKYNIVLDKREAGVYFVSGIDNITDKVLERYNKQWKPAK